MDYEALIAALDPAINWEQAYHAVEVRVVQYFREHPEQTLTATELGKVLLPPSEARGLAGAAAAQRVFRALEALSKHSLKHYATPSSVQKILYGKKYYPTNWHAPKISYVECCPHCKRPYDQLQLSMDRQPATINLQDL